MDERVLQFRVGLMVLATLLIAGILVVMFGEAPNLIRPKYTIHIWLREAPGVSVDTPVRKSGILIGRVTEVEFADQITDREEVERIMRLQDIAYEDFAKGVVVTAEIFNDKRIYQNETCRVNKSLMGDSELQIVPGGRLQPPWETGTAGPPPGALGPPGLPCAPGEPGELRGPRVVRDGQFIRGELREDPLEAVADLQTELLAVMRKVGQAADSVNQTVTAVAQFVRANELELKMAVNRAGRALGAVEQMANNANRLIGDQQIQAQIKETVARMPQVLDEARVTIAGLRGVMDSLDRNLRSLEDFTEPLGQNADARIARVDHAIDKLDTLVTQLELFGRALNSDRSTLGRLAREPDVYDRLHSAVQNIDEMTGQLKPILHDARVFTDKIARHPEQLGVRGVLQRSPGIK
jgi:phospholipid/cholesterol/gamma-HCH transport system substrate-binding protein